MAWVMKRVTGQGLADMVSDQIWQRSGMEEDGYITVDSIGVPFGGGGMSASLRDLARFGEMMRCDGAARVRSVAGHGTTVLLYLAAVLPDGLARDQAVIHKEMNKQQDTARA